MANDGTMHVDNLQQYEDLITLKKYIRSGFGPKYDPANVHEIHKHIVQTSTGTAVELENTDSIAISQIGRTELTLLLAGDADNASTNGKTYTFVYKDQDGVSHTAVGTGTATLNGTPVAFVPAVSDFYAAVSFTASAADANVNVYAATAGIAATYATISTTATEATEAQLTGVGSVYIRSHTNHNDADGAVVFGEYLSGYGTIKYMHGTIPAADGTVETTFFEASVDADTGVYTAGTTTVKDFYRVRSLFTDTTPTANSHEFLVTDADCGNVDGSSGDIYAVILEGSVEWSCLRYTPPIGYDAWVAHVHANATQAAAGDSYRLDHYYKLDKGQITHVEPHYFDTWAQWEEPELLEEMEDTYFTVLDTAGAAIVSVGLIIIEAKRNS